MLWRCWLGGRKGIWPVKTEYWVAGVVICLERGADLHIARLMPLPLTVSCFSKIEIGFTFLVPAHLVVPEKGPLNGCVLAAYFLGNISAKNCQNRYFIVNVIACELFWDTVYIDTDLHLTRCSGGESTAQTTSRSVEPFFSWLTNVSNIKSDSQTEIQTTQLVTSVATAGLENCSQLTMRPNNTVRNTSLDSTYEALMFNHKWFGCCICHLFVICAFDVHLSNKYVGPPYSRTKIYAALVSCSSSIYQLIPHSCGPVLRIQQQTHCPQLLLLIDGTDRRTDGHSTVLWRLPHTMRNAW